MNVLCKVAALVRKFHLTKQNNINRYIGLTNSWETNSFFTLITICNQRLYLLTHLKKQGLKLTETDNVFKSIILTKLIYATPALFGYLT